MTPRVEREFESRLKFASEFSRRDLVPGLLSEFPCFVGRVFGNPMVPATNNLYVSVNPVDVWGNEVEGGLGSLTVDGSRIILVFLVGSKPAMEGDFIVCRFLGNRWIGERLGKTSTNLSLPGCPCKSLPTTLTMTSSKPTSNNRIFQNATIVYGATPPSLAALNLGSKCFLSTAQFTDFSTGDQFWYYFGCYNGFYGLSRVYTKFQFLTPYRDQVRYTWLVGTAGNSCTPFLLSKGTIYSGGDASCIVTLTA